MPLTRIANWKITAQLSITQYTSHSRGFLIEMDAKLLEFVDHVSGKDTELINLPFKALLDKIIFMSKRRKDNPLNFIS